jgi:hypothetical protein
VKSSADLTAKQYAEAGLNGAYSILQNQTASIYPGLLDGIQVECDYPDAVTTLLEVADCVLLVNAYQTPEWLALQTGLTQAQINAKKTAINGHLDQVGCQSWNNSFGFINKPGNYVPLLVVDQNTGALAPTGAPRNNCLLPASQVYDPVTNPNGTRCVARPCRGCLGYDSGHPRRSTRAVQPFDNVGIRSAKALLAGDLAQFMTLNEGWRHRRRREQDGVAFGRRPSALDVATAPSSRAARTSARSRSSTGAATTSRASTIWRSFSERARRRVRRPRQPGDVAAGAGLTPPLASGIMRRRSR